MANSPTLPRSRLPGGAQRPAAVPRSSLCHAYVGSRTTRQRHARGEGISVYRLDPHSAGLERIQLLGDLVNPSYLALDRRGETLYTVHGDLSEVSALRVDRRDGTLRLLNTQSSGGCNPVHLALAPDSRHLVVCNHIGASLAVLPIAEDGSLRPLSQLLPLSGEPGPHRVEQPHAKPHFTLFDASGRHLIVPDKGLDRLFGLRFAAGELTHASAVTTREAAGPRHVAFHPDGGMLYAVNELDSSVTSYAYEPQSARLAPRQVLSTLPSTFTGNSRAAGIQVDADGRFLYASNRGADSIAVFAIDPTDGLLSFVQAAPSRGRTPRFFTLSPTGRQLFALNEDSDSITTFDVDPQHGTLSARPEQIVCASPVCMVFSS